jgi:riboflavin biosynthesis pyrimidine reductase
VFHRIHPSAAPLDDDGLHAAYARPAGVPHLRAGFVASLDGAATVDGRAGGLGGPADQRVLQVLRTGADAVLVGAGTVRAEGYGGGLIDDASVARRMAEGMAAYPTLVIATARLDLDPGASVFTDARTRPVVVTRDDADPARIAALEPVADVVRAGAGEVDLAAALAVLRSRGLARIVCEGGPSLYGRLVASGLVDDLCLTIAPIVAGGDATRITAGAPEAVRRMPLAHLLVADGLVFGRWSRH